MPKTHIQLGEVQETLLIPLYGRAVESQKADGMLYDPSAVEMVNAIDYDFSKWDDKPSLPGSCLRTLGFDRWVKQFLEQHPQGTVIELGVGLNTRYERLDNGLAQWLELDLPDTMALRELFFENTSNRYLLAALVTDPNWVENVKALPGPYCFVAEAMLIYLQPEQVKELFALIHQHFPGAELLFDSMNALMQKNQQKHDVMKNMQARFSWSIRHPRQLSTWHPDYLLCESLTMYDLFQFYPQHVPWGIKALYGITRWLFPPFAAAYRLNHIHLGRQA